MNEHHDAKGRFSSGNSAASMHETHARMDALAQTAHPADGTYDRYGHSPKSGYMIGGAPDKGSRYTGVWTDPATNITYREKSTRVSSQVMASSLARQRNQISGYDLGRRTTFNTGGTGAYTPRASRRLHLAGV